MPRKGQAYPVDAEWRREVESRLVKKEWTRADLARSLRSGKGTISNLLNGVHDQSTLVPAIEKALGMKSSSARTATHREIDEVVAELPEAVQAQILGMAKVLREQEAQRRAKPDKG